MDSETPSVHPEAGSPTYWLTRFMILRLLGVIYAVAFLVAINQIVPLIGAHGLLPVDMFLKQSEPMRWGQIVAYGLCAPAVGILAMAFRYCAFNRVLDRFYTFVYSSGRLCQCAAAGCIVVFIYVDSACRARLVWLWLGNTAYRNRVPCHFPLPAAGYAPVPAASAAYAYYRFVPMA